MFLAVFLLLFIFEHPNKTAHGYTQPSQSLPVLTSSENVSGDVAGVTRLNKRKQKPHHPDRAANTESKALSGTRLLTEQTGRDAFSRLLPPNVFCLKQHGSVFEQVNLLKDVYFLEGDTGLTDKLLLLAH